MDTVVDLPMPPDAAERPSNRPRPITAAPGASGYPARSGGRRKWLLLGAAVTALGTVAGAGVFLAGYCHGGHYAAAVPVPHAVQHLPVPSARPALDGHDTRAETIELLALRQPPLPSTANPATAGTPKQPAAVPAAVAAVPASVPAAASLPPVTIHEVGAVSRPVLGDASDRAARLQAAPLASADQVQVLQLVTEEATLIRQQRQELAELRADQQSLRQTVRDTLADYGRRLSLSEATSALGEARSSAQAAVATAAATRTTPGVAHPPAVARPVAADVPLGSRRYRVQAASPRLAMLVDEDSDAQVAIAPGDILPGYGRVTAIMQSGTRWQISTEHGSVR